NHTEPFPNSEVKRCCGHDSLGVALRKNSSMPGIIIQLKPPQIIMRRLQSNYDTSMCESLQFRYSNGQEA
ncbi:MAG: hypothetical protein V7K24_09325, partial [Nostoc sp.]